MARVDLRNPANAEGDWFVDLRCIDCGTCREVAPELFEFVGGRSVVTSQPSGPALPAWLAAQACPTSSIGTVSRRPRPGRLYPRAVVEGSGVYDLGYCSEDSFGASAWFVVRPEGNVLVDSPRWTEALVAPLASLGGIAHVLLTHRDDVADASRWAERFGARVWIHADDAAAAPFATDVFTDEVEVLPGLVAVPVPGHTRGSAVFVLDEQWCFSGDSLAWDLDAGRLTAFRGACWYSWPAQTESLVRLAATHRFTSVLPGHGGRIVGARDLDDDLLALVERMRRG